MRLSKPPIECGCLNSKTEKEEVTSMFEGRMKMVSTETGGMELVSKTIEEIFADETFYAAKALRSIRSGFVELQSRVDGGWEKANEYSDSHYVCVVFKDGGHIPLPLILPVAPEAKQPYDTEWALQDRIIEIATEAGLLDDAITACALQVIMSGSSQAEEEMKRDALAWLDSREITVKEFYGNHADGFDRILDETPGIDMVPGEAWRDDCEFALSPYWRGAVICAVPKGCDFSQHPPIVATGFQVLRVEERETFEARNRDIGKNELDCPYRDPHCGTDMPCSPGSSICQKGFDPDRQEGDLISDITCWLDEPADT